MITQTRLLELNARLPNGNRVFAKCEFENPSGSHYGRVYPHIISKLENGANQRFSPIPLTREKHELLENSSGNGGVAFCIVAKERGYDATVVFPPSTPEKKVQSCKDNGANVIFPYEFMRENGIGAGEFLQFVQEESKPVFDSLVKWLFGGKAPNNSVAMDKFEEIVRFSYILGTNFVVRKLMGTISPRTGKEYFFVNHSSLPCSREAMHPVAEEVRQQMDGKKVDYFVPALGNGVSAIGIGEALKGNLTDGQGPYPNVKIVGFEAEEAPVVAVMKYGMEGVAGKYGIQPDFHPHSSPGVSAYGIDFRFLRKNLEMIEDVVLVQKSEWKEAQVRLLSSDGLFAGPTSAMGLVAVEKLAKNTEGKNFLIVMYDLGIDY